MFPRLVGAVALCILYSGTSMALSTAKPCNDCSHRQVRQKARHMNDGYHYIYDMKKEKLTYWYVDTGDVDLNPRVVGQVSPTLRGVSVEEKSVPTSVKNWFEDVVDYYHKNDDSLWTSIQVKYDNGTISQISNSSSELSYESDSYSGLTAWDVSEGGYARQALVNKLNNTTAPSFLGGLMNVFQLLYHSPILNLKSATLSYKVYLGDNDKTWVRMNWNTQKRSFEYVRGSAHDKNGNPIPDDNQDASEGKKYGYTAGTQSSAGHMLTRLHNLGAHIDGTTGDGYIVAISCSGSGNDITCIVQVQQK